MATSYVGIVNLALSAMGEDQRIVALSDNTKPARLANSMYEAVRDKLLRRFGWRFALERDELAADGTAPTWGFSYRYAIPGNSLLVDMVGEFYCGPELSDYVNAPMPQFSIEGGYILTDLTAPLKIRYRKRVVDASLFDAAFVGAYAAYLEYMMAMPLTQSRARKDEAAVHLRQELRDAITANAIEVPPNQLPDDTWILGRL